MLRVVVLNHHQADEVDMPGQIFGQRKSFILDGIRQLAAHTVPYWTRLDAHAEWDKI